MWRWCNVIMSLLRAMLNACKWWGLNLYNYLITLPLLITFCSRWCYFYTKNCHFGARFRQYLEYSVEFRWNLACFQKYATKFYIFPRDVCCTLTYHHHHLCLMDDYQVNLDQMVAPLALFLHLFSKRNLWQQFPHFPIPRVSAEKRVCTRPICQFPGISTIYLGKMAAKPKIKQAVSGEYKSISKIRTYRI